MWYNIEVSKKKAMVFTAISKEYFVGRHVKLELAKEKGIEILYMTEPVDEFGAKTIFGRNACLFRNNEGLASASWCRF